MSRTWWPVLAGLPIVVCLAVLRLAEGLRDWTALPAPVLAGAFADALLVNALILVLGAPVMGVAAARGAASTARIAGRLGASLLLFTAVSAMLSLAGWGLAPGSLRAVATSHVTMWAGAMAFASLGTLCGRWFRHPLDGAGASLGITILLAIGILIAGPYASDLPRYLIDGALLASPLITTAAAADIDLLRTDVLYQVSPLAHVGTTYPAWYVATGVYFMFTAVCLTGVVLVSGSKSHGRR